MLDVDMYGVRLNNDVKRALQVPLESQGPSP